MSIWLSATLFLSAAGQSAPVASGPAESSFVALYRDCLLGVAIHRARTTALATEAILANTFVACDAPRRAAKEGGVAGEEPKISEAWLARLDRLERQRLRMLIDANRGKGDR